MIGTLDIKLQSAHPNLPLEALRTFVGSPSQVRILNVPKQIGNWKLTKVYISANYPDNALVSAEATLTGGCYHATLDAPTASGTSLLGFTVTADGVKEDGTTAVTGYVLGKGAVVVYDTDSTITVGTTTHYLHLLDTVPTSGRKKGDVAVINGVFRVWMGNSWQALGGDVDAVHHADFAGVAAIGDRYGIADLKGKVNEMLGILKGTATAVALILALASYGALETQTARLDALYNDSLVVTNVTGGGDGGVSTNAVKAILNEEVGGTNTLAHIGDKVAWSNVTNAPDFASKAYADQYANQAPLYGTVSNMAVNSAQIVGPQRSVTVGECIISRQGSENSSFNGSYFYDYNGEAMYYLPWSALWATANASNRIARIVDIPTDYIPAAGDTNSVGAILSAARTDSESIAEAKAADTRAIVATWENFLDGSNVVFSITNYISGTYNLDNAKFRILEMTNGFYREVYNSREEIKLHIDDFEATKFRVATNQVITSVNEKIAGKADKAWGRYTSAGGEAPSNTVYMTEPQTVFAGGLEYERVAVGEGAVCILTTKGAPVYTAGDEGTFKFQDDGGTNYFGFAKTDSYTIGCNTDGITVQNSIVTLTYNVTMSGVPCIWYKQDVGTAGPWEQLNLSDGTAVPGASHLVTWDMSPAAGTEVCYINCANQAKGFFKATVEVQGSAKFMTNMPADLGGGIICTNTATGVNGVIRPSFNGSTVIWSWSAQ